jgi:hypothetical protein
MHQRWLRGIKTSVSIFCCWAPHDRKLNAAAENETKDTRRGLWADADPKPPWNFRHWRSHLTLTLIEVKQI